MLDEIIALIRSEYLASEVPTWVVAFSGGKDSTLLLDLFIRAMFDLGRDKWNKRIFVIANDTLVESPVVAAHLDRMLERLRSFFEEAGFPAEVAKTYPNMDNTFWVNLIGRGYPPPKNRFRWCTEALKIRPTTRFLRMEVRRRGPLMLLLGTRTAESPMRKASIQRHEISHYFGRHSSLEQCMTFKPIRDLTDDEVWEYLGTHAPPWGGGYGDLISMYREANGGECPLIVDPEQMRGPSCGERSPRFGCWTCTLVKKDRSLEGMVKAGRSELARYARFRDWLKEFGGDWRNRMPYSRNGTVRYSKAGTIKPGPFTLEARSRILEELRRLEAEVGRRLITQEELDHIERIWRRDRSVYEFMGRECFETLYRRMLGARYGSVCVERV